MRLKIIEKKRKVCYYIVRLKLEDYIFIMSGQKHSLTNICAFIGLVILALLLFINNVLPLLGISLGGKILSALSLIKDIAILFAIVFGAYSFASGSKTKRIIFWISLAIYVACAICGIF